MAGPDEWQPLWERRDMDDQEREGRVEPIEPTLESRFEAVRHRLPIVAAALLVVFIFCGVMRAILGLFGTVATPQAMSLHMCVTASFGDRSLGDLAQSFLLKQGAKSLNMSVDPTTGDRKITAQLPGQAEPTTIAIEPTDAATAFDHLAGHVCELAVVARESTPLEGVRFHGNPLASLIALDGAVVVVHPDNPVRSLTIEEIRAIFGSELNSWKSLTAENRPVTVVLPERGAEEISLFASRVLEGQIPSVHFMRSAQVALDVAGPLARGSIGLATFHNSDPARIIRIVDNDGRVLAPSTLSLGRRTYPLTMPIYAYADQTNMTNAAYQFLLYIGSSEGQNVLVNDGFVSPSAF